MHLDINHVIQTNGNHCEVYTQLLYNNFGLSVTPWQRPYLTLYQKTKFKTGPNSKHFAGNNFKVAIRMISIFDRVENIVGKGENASYQHFLLFPQCFPKASFLGVVKIRDCVLES